MEATVRMREQRQLHFVAEEAWAHTLGGRWWRHSVSDGSGGAQVGYWRRNLHPRVGGRGVKHNGGQENQKKSKRSEGSPATCRKTAAPMELSLVVEN
jgi:hypothetical protein